MNEPDLPHLAGGHEAAGTLDHRIAAIGQGHHRVPTSTLRLLRQGIGRGTIQRNRLLHDHVLARLQCRLREGHMRVVRGADVHDIHIGVADDRKRVR